MGLYLGLDLGTSGLKALLLTATGDVVGTAAATYEVSVPHQNWSEQDPNNWVKACSKLLTELRANHRIEFEQIAALSLSGHMHGAVVVDEKGTALRPCILWNDMRSDVEATQLDGKPEFREISGNIVFPGFTAPKLLWIKNHEPNVFGKIHKVLLPKDYLLHWLTGHYVTDYSDASGTSWLDVEKRDWSDLLLNASGMRRDQMPALVNGCDAVDLILPELARQFGLSPSLKIVAGGADNAVAACGVGAVDKNQGFVSLGTSGVILVARDSYAAAPKKAVHTFCHAVPDRWYQMGVILSATNSLNWLAKLVGMEPAELAGLCGDKISGPSQVVFLPYLNGERTPHNDANIGGAFIGLKTDTSTADLCQAVMEGVSFALRDCLETLNSTGTTPTELLAIGGGTKSNFWAQTLATILNLRLALPEDGEFGGALGAARLALVGDGYPLSEVLTKPKIAQVVSPDQNLQSKYETAYQRFRKLYQLLKETE